MKVVLFCGGYGMRMRDGAHDDIPKPMQLVGPRPLLWHVMRYYASHGHTDFILCLGYGAQHIKNFFLTYRETASNDFRLRDGEVEMLTSDISGWDITFAGTGLNTGIGDRLRAVRQHLEGEEMFLANYADVLCDADLCEMVRCFRARPEMVVSMLAVPPQSSFHVLGLGDKGPVHTVTSVRPVSELPMRENGGYLILRQEIFDWLDPGADLVGDACEKLACHGRLMAQCYDGFWKPADTFKERAELDAMWARGERPWAPAEGARCTP